MSRRGENIFKRKDGRWKGRYISSYLDNGKANYSSVYKMAYVKFSCNFFKGYMHEKPFRTSPFSTG